MVVDFFGTFSQRKFHIGKNRMGQANVNFNIDMDPSRSFIELNNNVSTGGISIGDKVSNMLNGGDNDKMKSLYRSFKDDVEVS